MRKELWLPCVVLLMACGCGSGDEGQEGEYFGFHASGRGDVSAGKLALVLGADAQTFTCNQEPDGPLVSIFANGASAGDYAHFTGSMEQIPTMGFQGVLSDVVAGEHLNKRASTGGTMNLAAAPTGATLEGTLSLTFEGGEQWSGSFGTQGCDLEL